jgi:glycine hydroxymethyltransferase
MISALRNLSKSAKLYQRLQAFSTQEKGLFENVQAADKEMYEIIEGEKKRQRESVNLIASENYVSKAVLEAVGSVLTNKYSEGYSGARYYGGNEFIDKSESLCKQRALEAFNLDNKKWDVNVQPLSGSPANFYVYTALLNPHERIMSLDLPHGGHLSHGYQTDTRKVSAVSTYFEVLPYRLNEKTGIIDYDKLEEMANIYRPKLIIAGASAYSRHYDYARMRKICDSVNAYLLCDMAHIAGMVSAGLVPNPFDHGDIVTTTTHKSLRGPRGAMIFFRQGVRKQDKQGKDILYDLKTKIDNAVFPGHQGGPHNHTIAGLSVALHQAKSADFKDYQSQILKNCQQMVKSLLDLKYPLVSGGSDNHLVLVDVGARGIDGERVTTLLETANISVNKNTIPGDKSAVVPRGIRLGTPAMTTRGCKEKEFAQIVEFIDRGVGIAKKIKGEVGTKLSDYKHWLEQNAGSHSDIQALKKEVVQFSSQYKVPQ